MRLQVIGTGSAGNAYLLSDDASGDALLLDAGVSQIQRISKALYKIRPTQTRACLVTHEHGDHACSVRALSMMGIPCYGTQGTAAAVGPEMRILRLYEPVTIGSYLVAAFPVNHDAADPCGYLINNLATGERLIYATDTYYLRHKYPGVHYWLIECNYCDECLTEDTPPQLLRRLRESHMSLDRLCGVFRANDLSACKAIILCHTSHERGDKALMLRRIREITHKRVEMAEPGQIYDLKLQPF